MRYAIQKAGGPFLLCCSPKYENQRVKEVVKEHDIHAIISDNRYGFYHESLPSVFITHQLQIRTGLGNGTDSLLRRLHYGAINRFTECWVPDGEYNPNLSGLLAHPPDRPRIPVHYLGPLSRFNTEAGEQKGSQLLVILSGPEPQRTLLETLLMEQVRNYEGKVVLVRGRPGDALPLQVPAHITAFNHLPASLLQEEIKKA